MTDDQPMYDRATYDLTTERTAERAYLRSLMRAGAPDPAIKSTTDRIEALSTELRRRGIADDDVRFGDL